MNPTNPNYKYLTPLMRSILERCDSEKKPNNNQSFFSQYDMSTECFSNTLFIPDINTKSYNNSKKRAYNPCVNGGISAKNQHKKPRYQDYCTNFKLNPIQNKKSRHRSNCSCLTPKPMQDKKLPYQDYCIHFKLNSPKKNKEF